MLDNRLERIILRTLIVTLILGGSAYLGSIFYFKYESNSAHMQAINMRSSICYSPKECSFKEAKAKELSKEGEYWDSLYSKLIFKK